MFSQDTADVAPERRLNTLFNRPVNRRAVADAFEQASGDEN